MTMLDVPLVNIGALDQATSNLAEKGVLGSLVVILLALFLYKDRQVTKAVADWIKQISELEKSHAAHLDTLRAEHKATIEAKDTQIAKMMSAVNECQAQRTQDANRFADKGIEMANDAREDAVAISKSIDALLSKVGSQTARPVK